MKFFMQYRLTELEHKRLGASSYETSHSNHTALLELSTAGTHCCTVFDTSVSYSLAFIGSPSPFWIGCVWVWSEGIALSCSPPMFPFCSGASSGSMVPATYYSTSVAISLFSSLALVFYYVV